MREVGRFLTVEGGEGAGKSLFSQGLFTALTARGLTVLQSREPGGTPLADQIRRVFLEPPVDDRPVPMTELLLVSAARHQHITRRIKPALQAGQWVLCDRFYDSTRAYQGLLHGLPEGSVEQVISVSVGDCHPDLTFILDCPPSVVMSRIEARMQATGQRELNRYDGGSLNLHQKLRDAYLELAKRFPQRIVVLDASQTPEAVLASALKIIEERWTQ